jgi:hypothetical protein
MHAKSSDNRTAAECPTCRGSGRSAHGTAADQFLTVPEGERAARFAEMGYHARAALFETNAAEYRRLAGGGE